MHVYEALSYLLLLLDLVAPEQRLTSVCDLKLLVYVTLSY